MRIFYRRLIPVCYVFPVALSSLSICSGLRRNHRLKSFPLHSYSRFQPYLHSPSDCFLGLALLIWLGLPECSLLLLNFAFWTARDWRCIDGDFSRYRDILNIDCTSIVWNFFTYSELNMNSHESRVNGEWTDEQRGGLTGEKKGTDTQVDWQSYGRAKKEKKLKSQTIWTQSKKTARVEI